MKDSSEGPHGNDVRLLIDELSLPEMKRILTEESSVQKGGFDLETSLSGVVKKDDLTFEDVFELIYRVQDSMHNILTRIPTGRSPSLYKKFFRKTELNRINVFLKMEYVK